MSCKEVDRFVQRSVAEFDNSWNLVSAQLKRSRTSVTISRPEALQIDKLAKFRLNSDGRRRAKSIGTKWTNNNGDGDRV